MKSSDILRYLISYFKNLLCFQYFLIGGMAVRHFTQTRCSLQSWWGITQVLPLPASAGFQLSGGREVLIMVLSAKRAEYRLSAHWQIALLAWKMRKFSGLSQLFLLEKADVFLLIDFG